jgi:hypothetical protein
MKSRRKRRCGGNVERMGEVGNVYRRLVGEVEGEETSCDT